jgi:hypothetical protein
MSSRRSENFVIFLLQLAINQCSGQFCQETYHQSLSAIPLDSDAWKLAQG